MLAAVTGEPWEPELMSALESAPIRVLRRCVDLADLLAAASVGTADAVLVSPALRRLDRDAVSRLADLGVLVVGVTASDDEPGERRLRQIGVPSVLPAGDVTQVVDALLAEIGAYRSRSTIGAGDAADSEDLASGQADAGASEVTRTGGQQRRPVSGNVSARAVAAAPPEGRVVAIWGPTGAPGRTTIAVNLAAELAHAGTPTLLADADVYGGVLAQVLGVLDEAPGLAAAVRLANNGRLDAAELAGLAREVSPHLRVLTGLARADRWMELRPPALEALLDLARRLAEVTVLDCGFCLERDEVLSFDTAAPQRNGATLAALAAADVVIAVGAADPVGIARLVRGLGELRDVAPAAQLVVVANRVRRGPIGGQPGARLREALASHADVRDVVLVPDDRSALDESLLLGRSLVESAPSSPVRAALAEIATAAGLGPTAPARRASRWRRVRPLTRRNARPVLLR